MAEDLLRICAASRHQMVKRSQADVFHAHDLSVKRKEPLTLKHEVRVDLVGIQANPEQAPRADHLAQAHRAIIEESACRAAAQAADGARANFRLVGQAKGSYH